MEVPNKQLYRAIKYVWSEEWIGKEANDNEIQAALRACTAEIVADYGTDQERILTEPQVKLTAMHIEKYGHAKVIRHIDHCYDKVLLEVYL